MSGRAHGDGPANASASSSARDAGATGKIPASVLLVDDHPANLTALEAVLEPLDVRLVRATSGEEALWRLLEEDFALVLLDVQMPGLDGFRVASLIRERPATRTLPIIFLTALSREPAHVFKGYEHGAVDYLVKPLDSSVLRSKVAVFVDLYRKTKLIERQAELLRRKEREELQRRGEHRFRSLMESVADCIWAAHTNGQFYYANRRARGCALEGDRPARSFLDALHPDDAQRVGELWRASLRTGETFEVECRLAQPAGAWRWHIVRGVPERDEQGGAVGWIVSSADIDRRKAAENELLETQRELRIANEAKDAFLAAASHELRSPLSAAKGQAYLALKKVGDDTTAFPGKAFAVIMRQIERMARLVEDFVDVSRIQHGRLSLDLERFDLDELASEVIERIQATTVHHTLRSEVPAGLGLRADRGRLDQVLTNLTANAVRYSPNGGSVCIGANVDDVDVHIVVRDEGVGVPPDKLRAIFERYGRAHGDRYGGLGLGLTICEGIVLQHGGRIWVESEGVPGKGSTFHVRLPRLGPTSDRANAAGAPDALNGPSEGLAPTAPAEEMPRLLASS